MNAPETPTKLDDAAIDATRRQLFGNGRADWQRITDWGVAYYEFQPSLPLNKEAVGVVLLALGVQDGRASFHDGKLRILAGSFVRHIAPHLTSLQGEPTPRIYRYIARDLLFGQGHAGWNLAGDDYQRIVTPKAEDRKIPDAVTRAMEVILTQAGVMNATIQRENTSNRVIVSLPKDAFEAAIAPQLNPTDAGLLKQERPASQRRH